MLWKQSLKLLKSLGLGLRLKHERSIESAVTLDWGVDWDEDFIARDIMQNFYDGNRRCIGKIDVHVDGSTVTISAPEDFDLNRLFYLGSDKGSDDVGQYGEGFKVATVCLIRDHRVEPIVMSNDQVLVIRLAENKVENTDLRPLAYDFFKTTDQVSGTKMILRGCSKILVEAFRSGLNHFFYPSNPLLGQKLWESWDSNFAIYESTTDDGHAFYRNLKRGQVSGIPLILVINKEYKRLESKIQKDRDRNAFGDELLQTYYSMFAQYGINGHVEAEGIVVGKTRHCWASGHKLLREVADRSGSWRARSWSEAQTQQVFGDTYFARMSGRLGPNELKYEEIERGWKKEGKTSLPSYFHRFGLITAQKHLEEIEKKARAEAINKDQRPPSTYEKKALAILNTVLQELTPELNAFFQRGTRYSVITSELLLGQMKDDRGYHEREVYLSDRVFVANFSEALSVYLHEHAHIYGYDGDRAFTDALTDLIEKIVRNRQSLDAPEKRWLNTRHNVIAERRQKSGLSIEETVKTKSLDELQALIMNMPEDLVKPLL